MDAKPLPSPPVAQIMTTSPLKQTRSLIDATEKPLRRSPPGKPHEVEEWPVLLPDRPTTPSTLRKVVPSHNGALETVSTVEILYQPAERYPRLPSMEYKPLTDDERKPSSAASKNHVQRKQVSSPNLHKALTTAIKENIRPTTAIPKIVGASTKSSTDIPAKEGTGLSLRSQHPNERTVVAVKPSIDTKPSIEPRQTRTSSLRARLS